MSYRDQVRLADVNQLWQELGGQFFSDYDDYNEGEMAEFASIPAANLLPFAEAVIEIARRKAAQKEQAA